MDKAVRNSFSEKVNKWWTKPFMENELKRRTRDKRDKISVEETRTSISDWKRHLRAIFEQIGGHIDHFMSTTLAVIWFRRPALLVLTNNVQDVTIFTIFKLLGLEFLVKL